MSCFDANSQERCVCVCVCGGGGGGGGGNKTKEPYFSDFDMVPSSFVNPR